MSSIIVFLSLNLYDNCILEKDLLGATDEHDPCDISYDRDSRQDAEPRGCYADLYPEELDGIRPTGSDVDKAVLARCISTEPEEGEDSKQVECLPMLPRFRGVFKADPGEGDRIVIMDRKKRILLDVDYWWSTKPGATE